MKTKQQIDKLFPIGKIVRDFPYAMVFKTTKYCWYRCPHCCEDSGPHQPRDFIPLEVIHYYLSQAVQDRRYSGDVVLTGGEIMASYRFGDKNYVPNLLNMCLDAGLSTDIKTNAGWAHTDFGKQIYADLADVITRHKKYDLQISLSLDDFHTNSMKNNLRVLEQFAGDKLPVIAHVSSFAHCNHMYDELLSQLRKRGVSVENFVSVNPQTRDTRQVTMLNQSVIISAGYGALFDGGRAKQLPQAKHIKYPQFSFLTPDGFILMAFDTDGNVTLGENSGQKISTPWRAGPDGRIWKLDAICDALVTDARKQELHARLFQGYKRNR